ncbi:MAG: hypothetical protein Q8P56_01355, partial [Candidatus Uhrbacteria bacterium]|nr:hypothetical protein [Candidatus Uhrbacteria bacterium]
MTLEVPPEGEQLQGKYEQVMFGALQSREEYFAERERFSQLAFQECSPPVPVEKAHEIFDTRKFLMSLAARYASEKFVLTED